jgi:ABC-2 type transport system permease protein
VSAVPDSLEKVVMYNPISVILTQFRHAVIDQEAPTAGTAIGGLELIAIPLAIVAAIFAIGLWVFTREAPRIAENL